MRVMQMLGPRILSDKDKQDFDALWFQWDLDGNGVLDHDEFKFALRTLNLETNDVDAIYREVDTDGNGTIDKEEFATWYFTDQVKMHGAGLL